MDPRNSKVTAVVRVLLGAVLLYGGWVDFGDPLALSQRLGLPFASALWLSLGEFSLGLCLLLGVLSRWCGLVVLLGALWLMTLAGAGSGLVLTALAGLYLTLRGGGAYSTDRYIGHMQRRVSERELARQAARAQAGPGEAPAQTGEPPAPSARA